MMKVLEKFILWVGTLFILPRGWMVWDVGCPALKQGKPSLEVSGKLKKKKLIKQGPRIQKREARPSLKKL
jgi:hypothetical protein